jgi:hypothetical protein
MSDARITEFKKLANERVDEMGIKAQKPNLKIEFGEQIWASKTLGDSGEFSKHRDGRFVDLYGT